MRSLTVPFALAVALLAGCPGDDDPVCGIPPDAAAPGIESSTGTDQFTYGNFTAIHAGDCGRESITIDATQISPTVENFHFVLCVARADHIGSDPIPLAGESGDGLVELVDASARTPTPDCTIAIDFTATPQGTATFAGYCDTAGTGFLLTLDGAVAGTRTCAGLPVESVLITLSGSAAMTLQ
jgi:hypothetical protein